MCYYRRILFACNHSHWHRSIVRKCDTAKAGYECWTMDSHPLHTVGVNKRCASCRSREFHMEDVGRQIAWRLAAARGRLGKWISVERARWLENEDGEDMSDEKTVVGSEGDQLEGEVRKVCDQVLRAFSDDR
jgi:hypothetical protein